MSFTAATTNVTFPSGGTEGSATVLAAPMLPDGRIGVVVDVTPFHPLDHNWPDQPADAGTLGFGGLAHAVVDCVTGGLGPDGEFAIGGGIPVRRGDESWSWLAVHVLDADTVAAADPVVAADVSGDAAGEAAGAALVGQTVELHVDENRRDALSAAHTGCHLLALALNEALAERWKKDVPPDALGHPNFDRAAIDTSRMTETGSVDRYRLGKSLRKKGFDAEGLREALPELTERINARLAKWVASDAAIRIDAPGPELTALRKWVAELPEATAEIFCGGTHLHRLGELGGLTSELFLSEDGTELKAVTTPVRS